MTDALREAVPQKVRSSFRGGEAKRALTATMLGAIFGALIVLFSRKDER